MVGQLGSVFDDVSTIVQKGQQYVDILVSVVEDPALPTIAGQIRTLRSMAQASAPRPAPGQTAPKVGIGLKVAVKPLGYYIWTRQHPVKTKFIIAGVVAAPILIGFLLGRVTKRTSTSRAKSTSAIGARKTALAGGRLRRRTTRTSSRR